MKNVILISWVFSLMFVGTVSATIIDVPFDQPTIQVGIDSSSHGDTVRVASGTYVENINFSGKNVVLGSWFLDAGDTSFISSTIIDGNQSGSVVSFLNGEDNSAVITGFTIQNGVAQDGGGIHCFYNSSPMITDNTINGNSATNTGGGIFCYFANPTIINNTISGNTASNGGGIFCGNVSNPTISNNTISENTAVAAGGGISCMHQSNPMIGNNTISGNSAGNIGGGIYCVLANPTISNNTISGNTTGLDGGGIYCEGSSPTINYNTISGNSAAYDGGGIACYYSSPTINYNTISGNSVYWYGGGILCWDSNPTITNNTISGNSADYYGGGILCSFSSPTISDNTISGNSADRDGGGVYCWDSNPVITNTIFWADSAPTGPEIYLGGTSSPVITYCDVQGGWEGEGNIDIDPLFRDPDNGDFHLTWANFPVEDSTKSPCIDLGDPQSPIDPDGTSADIGAFYFDQSQSDIMNYVPIPDQFYLGQNYPNPFNTQTTISYALPYSSEIILDIYDILGRKVETLYNGNQPAGYHQVIWKADKFSSGVYFYKLQAGDYIETKKMALLK